MYSQSALAGADLNLSPGALILFALLRGGDYSKVSNDKASSTSLPIDELFKQGLPGCGATVAFRLTRYVDLSDSLYHAASAYSDSELQSFLHVWRGRLCDCLRYNPEDRLGRRYPTLAGSISLSFPDMAIIRAYARPLVSATPPYSAFGFDARPPRIDISKLAQLCEIHFGFGTPFGIVSTFEKNVWQGVLLRDLLCKILFSTEVEVMNTVFVRVLA